MATAPNAPMKMQIPKAETTKVRLNKKHPNTTEKLLGVIEDLVERQFTGYLKLNFSHGTIARVEKFEEILR